MLASLTAPDSALLLLAVTSSLAGALVWAFWEMEQRLRPLQLRTSRKPGRDAG